MVFTKENENLNNLRVIQTGRNEKSINEAIKKGFRPIFKQLVPSPNIKTKYAVRKNKITGKIDVLGDFRENLWPDDKEHIMIIPWTFYYPYSFESPYAAYLIPDDIEVGERVYLEDLIEDFIGGSWSQGDSYRLQSCEAIWNGNDFEIQYNPKTNNQYYLG